MSEQNICDDGFKVRQQHWTQCRECMSSIVTDLDLLSAADGHPQLPFGNANGLQQCHDVKMDQTLSLLLFCAQLLLLFCVQLLFVLLDQLRLMQRPAASDIVTCAAFSVSRKLASNNHQTELIMHDNATFASCCF